MMIMMMLIMMMMTMMIKKKEQENLLNCVYCVPGCESVCILAGVCERLYS